MPAKKQSFIFRKEVLLSNRSASIRILVFKLHAINSANGTAFKGGIMYADGLGVKIPFNRDAGFLLSFGYRYQKTSYTYNAISTDIIYNRLAVRAGFFL